MERLSRRTEHVLEVIREIKGTVLKKIDDNPEEICAEQDLKNIVTNTYVKVAQLHHVTESTVRDACTRSSDIDSSQNFYLLARKAILGNSDLAHQLAGTSKSNESVANIIAAFQNL